MRNIWERLVPEHCIDCYCKLCNVQAGMDADVVSGWSQPVNGRIGCVRNDEVSARYSHQIRALSQLVLSWR